MNLVTQLLLFENNAFLIFWHSSKADNGSSVSGGGMRQVATIFDVTNNSPDFKHPPLWLIMAQCDGQYIDLSPSDVDGDRVRCRWANLGFELILKKK